MILCIGGTDTGVGKTLVTAAIARAARAEGMRVVAIKPAETGWTEGTFGDGERLAAATGQASPPSALQRYRDPLAPPMAAEADPDAGAPDPDLWLATAKAAEAEADLVLVEGAGGLTSPLAWDCDLRDLARALDAPLLLVAANRIGVLHQLRAAVELCEHEGLGIEGLVLSALPASADDPSPATNPDLVGRVLGRYPRWVLPRVADEDEAARLYAEWMASQCR